MESNTLKSRVLETTLINWEDLQFIQEENFKEWVPSGDLKLQKSLLKYQFVDPFKVWKNEDTIYCLDGKHRYLDLKHLQENGVSVPEKLPATFLDCSDLNEAAELVLVYSSQYAKITNQGLLDFVSKYEIDILDMEEIALPTMDVIEIDKLLNPVDDVEDARNSLKEDFGLIPFSILDSRTSEWLQRKKHWKKLGFNSQETREDVELIAKSGQSPKVYNLRNKLRKALKREPSWDEILDHAKAKGIHIFNGASIFDPVLCECLYNWFTLKGHRILDPFAGGSVRGIVAGFMDREYFGIDLRLDQVESNEKQVNQLEIKNVGYCSGDSNEVLNTINKQFDFVFSCPPYHDLEQYSDDPKDLSNMDYDEFLKIYKSIIEKSVAKLKDDSFACFVVGDVRDKNGFYRNFVSDTIDCFRSAGMELYNEMILINAIGSMAIRLRKQFNEGRKCGKIHQNVLVFYKGDPKKIKEKYPNINIDKSLEQQLTEPIL